MKSFRPARVAEVIREVAAETILFKLRDPRISNVTVTRVEVSSDLQTAKVYVSVMADEQRTQQCMDALQRSSGFIQHQLADRLKLRFTPHLNFRLDKGIKNSLEVVRILKSESDLNESEEESTETSEGSPIEQGARNGQGQH